MRSIVRCHQCASEARVRHAPSNLKTLLSPLTSNSHKFKDRNARQMRVHLLVVLAAGVLSTPAVLKERRGRGLLDFLEGDMAPEPTMVVTAGPGPETPPGGGRVSCWRDNYGHRRGGHDSAAPPRDQDQRGYHLAPHWGGFDSHGQPFDFCGRT